MDQHQWLSQSEPLVCRPSSCGFLPQELVPTHPFDPCAHCHQLTRRSNPHPLQAALYSHCTPLISALVRFLAHINYEIYAGLHYRFGSNLLYYVIQNLPLFFFFARLTFLIFRGNKIRQAVVNRADFLRLKNWFTRVSVKLGSLTKLLESQK